MAHVSPDLLRALKHAAVCLVHHAYVVLKLLYLQVDQGCKPPRHLQLRLPSEPSGSPQLRHAQDAPRLRLPRLA